jgi:hypothetical protein
MLLAPLSLAALAFCAAQDPTPAPPAPTPKTDEPKPAGAQADPNDALVPGQLPADASEAAKTAWLAMATATSGATAQPKVTSFDMRFDVRVKGQGQHDLHDARYRYTEPGWICETLGEGILRVRGPKGDFNVTNGATTKLQGQDYATDRRELDERVQVARTFVGLIDPRALRISSLRVLTAPPSTLPASQLEVAKTLTWLEAISPDFQRGGVGATAKPRPMRAQIGLDPKTHLPQLAMVAADKADGTIDHETALLVKLGKWSGLDGYQVPNDLRTYPPDLTRAPWTFAETDNLRLVLLQGKLRPSLVETDFTPPKQP